MTAADIIRLWNIAAIGISLIGAAVCFWYVYSCRHEEVKYFRLFAGIVLLWFSLTYLLALFAPTGESFGVWYLVRSGIMTRSGVIALVVLLISWVYVDAGKCRRE